MARIILKMPMTDENDTNPPRLILSMNQLIEQLSSSFHPTINCDTNSNVSNSIAKSSSKPRSEPRSISSSLSPSHGRSSKSNAGLKRNLRKNNKHQHGNDCGSSSGGFTLDSKYSSSSKYISNSRSSGSSRVHDRLYNDAFIRKSQRKQKILKRNKIKNRNETAQCTFVPNIDSISDIKKKYQRKRTRQKHCQNNIIYNPNNSSTISASGTPSTTTSTTTTTTMTPSEITELTSSYSCSKDSSKISRNSRSSKNINKRPVTKCQPFQFSTDECSRSESRRSKNINKPSHEKEYEQFCTFKPDITPHESYFTNNRNRNKTKSKPQLRQKRKLKPKLKSYAQIHGANTTYSDINCNNVSYNHDHDHYHLSNHNDNSKNTSAKQSAITSSQNRVRSKSHDSNRERITKKRRSSLQDMLLSTPTRLIQTAKNLLSPHSAHRDAENDDDNYNGSITSMRNINTEKEDDTIENERKTRCQPSVLENIATMARIGISSLSQRSPIVFRFENTDDLIDKEFDTDSCNSGSHFDDENINDNCSLKKSCQLKGNINLNEKQKGKRIENMKLLQ